MSSLFVFALFMRRVCYSLIFVMRCLLLCLVIRALSVSLSLSLSCCGLCFVSLVLLYALCLLMSAFALRCSCFFIGDMPFNVVHDS